MLLDEVKKDLKDVNTAAWLLTRRRQAEEGNVTRRMRLHSQPSEVIDHLMKAAWGIAEGYLCEGKGATWQFKEGLYKPNKATWWGDEGYLAGQRRLPSQPIDVIHHLMKGPWVKAQGSRLGEEGCLAIQRGPLQAKIGYLTRRWRLLDEIMKATWQTDKGWLRMWSILLTESVTTQEPLSLLVHSISICQSVSQEIRKNMNALPLAALSLDTSNRGVGNRIDYSVN